MSSLLLTAAYCGHWARPETARIRTNTDTPTWSRRTLLALWPAEAGVLHRGRGSGRLESDCRSIGARRGIGACRGSHRGSDGRHRSSLCRGVWPSWQQPRERWPSDLRRQSHSPPPPPWGPS